MEGLIGKKVGMTQVYDADGVRTCVTVIEVGPCPVVQLKTLEKDGYSAAQVGFGPQKAHRLSKAEQKQILETTVTADKNPSYNTNAGSDTKDRVFLLSLSETNQYLTSNSARFCMPTAYAIKQNAYVDTSSGGCWWMMRTPGETGKKVVSTNTDGSIDYNGGIVESNRGGVRPAMWIDIS